MIALNDFWVWDSWYVWDRDTLHAFYLKAPKSLQNPDLRHHSATVGHSTSTDGWKWIHHPDALSPNPAKAFDDLAIWTGSVVWHDGKWHMFYTGIEREAMGRIQRIGHAISEDLFDWIRVDELPILTSQSPHYATATTDARAEEPFRDPWVFHHGGSWHMLITARAGGGLQIGAGNMAHATSSDLYSWKLAEPLMAETGFDQLEVFQVLQIEGRWFVIFCSQPRGIHRAGVSKRFATYAAPAAGPLGPFDLDKAQPIPDDGGLYAGRVVHFPDGSARLFGFMDSGAPDGFRGEISDPILLKVDESGCLVFDVEQASSSRNGRARLYADVSHRS